MFDRITEISENTGAYKKGFIKAELDIKDDLWFFNCHFKEDPVMPGCLGLDAMWQLVGFILAGREILAKEELWELVLLNLQEVLKVLKM